MIDCALITRKMSLVLQDPPKLTDLARLPREQYVGDPIHEVVAERYLERTIGRMIDINFHLVTESGQAPPKDYYNSFLALGTLGVMTADLAKQIRWPPDSATASCTNTMRSILSECTRRSLSRFVRFLCI